MYLFYAINTSLYVFISCYKYLYLQDLNNDLEHLQEMWPILLNVINYENSTNQSDFLLLLYLTSCKEKLNDVIDSLQNTVSDNCVISLNCFYYFTSAV